LQMMVKNAMRRRTRHKFRWHLAPFESFLLDLPGKMEYLGKEQDNGDRVLSFGQCDISARRWTPLRRQDSGYTL
jgi:hypothetical protein